MKKLPVNTYNVLGIEAFFLSWNYNNDGRKNTHTNKILISNNVKTRELIGLCQQSRQLGNLQLGQLLTPKGTSESGGIVNVKVFR